jgi:uncharacterized protein (TIGR02270 family)
VSLVEESAVNEVIEDLVNLYAEEAAFLWSRRNRVVRAPDYTLSDLSELDERLAAHLEGLHVSGVSGWHHCEKALENQGPGETFAAAVLALETTDSNRLERVLKAVEAAPEACPGAASALGWVDASLLRATVAGLLQSPSPIRRHIALSACALHRVDPGFASRRRLEDADPVPRARALRAVGELGQRGQLAACVAARGDKDRECRFWATWSSVLLGDHALAPEMSSHIPADALACQTRAFRLTLQAIGPVDAHRVLRSLSADAARLRWLIQGSGIAGDPEYVPWLVKHMADEKSARLAGEAFSLITGADFGQLGLEGRKPEEVQPGPNDDPDDPNVEMDPDDGLPWPDPEKIKDWWSKNSNRFTPGQRYFMGAPVTRAHCIDVLKNGYQRQRILAAHYLCLLDPGTPLFNTSAPAWRQQKVLAQMV